MRSISGWILLSYLLTLIYWMLLGFSRTPREHYSYNLIPFSTINNYFSYYSHYPLSIWLINIIGNIAVFVPFGLLIPLWKKRFLKFRSFILLFLIGITILELLQLYFRVGSFDVDDIILNSLGASIGILILKVILKIKSKVHII
ncbi:VanZ family protein [Litchfieldia alkalitelluris]|uniref:VanZ family protein n=1 Tax=Litchfieldia alkalitelluris TaxID=304268 RepID=UPI001F46232A|nr:VanZ family protein [Litchfieldia alkalitelluris]